MEHVVKVVEERTYCIKEPVSIIWVVDVSHPMLDSGAASCDL